MLVRVFVQVVVIVRMVVEVRVIRAAGVCVNVTVIVRMVSGTEDFGGMCARRLVAE